MRRLWEALMAWVGLRRDTPPADPVVQPADDPDWQAREQTYAAIARQSAGAMAQLERWRRGTVQSNLDWLRRGRRGG